MNKEDIKVAYISPDCFFDVDFPILTQLNTKYDLTWFPIIGDTNSRYSKDDVNHFTNKNNIKFNLQIRKGRRRDLKQLIFSYKLLCDIKKNKPDIIYTEYLNDIYLIILAILMLPRNKIIYAIHDVSNHTNFSSTALNFVKRLTCAYLKNFHLFSNTQKDIFESNHRNKNCFYAPLALKDFGKSDIKIPDKNSTCKFLFFGGITEYKGLDILINAFEELYKEGYKNILLTIAGNGKHWETCKKLIKTNNLYQLKIEFIPDNLIPDLYNSNHFLVLPYRDVTQSGPLMIAFNYNLPTIAADHPGFREYINNNETGFLFYNDLHSLKEVLYECYSMDEITYNRLKYNLERYVETSFNIQTIIRRYDDMFHKVINIK